MRGRAGYNSTIEQTSLIPVEVTGGISTVDTAGADRGGQCVVGEADLQKACQRNAACNKGQHGSDRR